MYYSEDEITSLLNEINIKELIEKYIKIEKIGNKWFGICPFHKENTPSFMVDEKKQIYYCFGCGRSGNTINFIMDYKKVSFDEAVKQLGLKKTEETKKISKPYLIQMNETAQEIYVNKLQKSKEAIQYTKERNLSEETIKKFGIGFSDKDKTAVYQKLKDCKYSKNEIENSGLVTITEDGIRDKFANRLMFPIHNENGFIIGFGGRLIKDTKKESRFGPKYLNSPETSVFDKSSNLFGLYFAKKSPEDYFILCEGYMDVIAMHQAGFTNAIASLGTAFTQNQARLIKKHKNKVILSYDSDGPGIQAAKRASKILEENYIEFKFLNLSPLKDPDEFIKVYGPKKFGERIQFALDKEDWFFKQALETNDVQLAIESIFPISN